MALPLMLLSSSACSSIASDERGTGFGDGDGGALASAGGEDGGGEGGSDPGAADETGGSEDEDHGPNDLPPAWSPCPSALPSSWIFCEDFEDMKDPSEVFFEYQDNDGRFVVVQDQGASGTRSLRAGYDRGKQSAGWANIMFGRNPIAHGSRPHHAAERDFDEIYWRLRVKMQVGWPDLGPHKLTRLTAFAHANWAQAVIANLWSNGSDVTLVGEPASCVLDGLVACSGFDDLDQLRFLPSLHGQTPLFSRAMSGEWHCVEGHVKLNTPGLRDGVFEFWIDDHLEAGDYAVDWRGTWTDYGLNLVSIENHWTGGAPADLFRWIDDIVIATEPIGCDE